MSGHFVQKSTDSLSVRRLPFGIRRIKLFGLTSQRFAANDQKSREQLRKAGRLSQMTHTPRWRPQMRQSTFKFKFKYVIKCKFWNSRWSCQWSDCHTYTHTHIYNDDDMANYKDQASAKFCHLIEIFASRLKLAFCCYCDYNEYVCVW